MAADVPHPGFEAYVGETVPQAAPGSPGKDGRLELAFERAGGETRLVRDYARAPFHVAGTLDSAPLDEAATVVVQSPTGGVAQGDRRQVTVEVAADAIAHVRTSASTKVYSMETNFARTTVQLSVADGGHLEYLPKPTILHPDSRYSEDRSLTVDPEATAIVGDVVVPGRLARGEDFDFERYYGSTEITGPDGLLAADAVHLQPGECSPQVPGVLGDASVLGTLFVIAPGGDTTDLSDAIHEAVASPESDQTAREGADSATRAGATALPNDAGVLVRAVAETTEPVRAALHRGRTVAREHLLDAPTAAPRW